MDGGGFRISWRKLEKNNVFTLLYFLPLPFNSYFTPQFLFHPPFLPLLFCPHLSYMISPPSLFSIWSFPSSPPPCLHVPRFTLLLSSSSAAAECCPSYLCSRLGMFFLLMTSVLSLPLHHFLFPVWAAHLPCVSYPFLPNHLEYCCCVVGGWRQAVCHG